MVIQDTLDFGGVEVLQKMVLPVQVKVVEGCPNNALYPTEAPLRFSQPSSAQGKDVKVLFILWDQ